MSTFVYWEFDCGRALLGRSARDNHQAKEIDRAIDLADLIVDDIAADDFEIRLLFRVPWRRAFANANDIAPGPTMRSVPVRPPDLRVLSIVALNCARFSWHTRPASDKTERPRSPMGREANESWVSIF